MNQAILLINEKKFDTAKHKLERLLQEAKTTNEIAYIYPAIYHLALCLYKIGHYGDAEQLLASTHIPQNASYAKMKNYKRSLLLSKIYSKLNKKELATKHNELVRGFKKNKMGNFFELSEVMFLDIEFWSD